MKDLKVGQLTKELVALRLKQMEDPCAVTADLIRQTLLVALKALPVGDPGRGKVIEDAVYGGMQGLLLGDHNLTRGAVLALEAVVHLAMELELDSAEAIKSALTGLSRLRRLLASETLHELHTAVEEHFNGAGEVFSLLLDLQAESGPSRIRSF